MAVKLKKYSVLLQYPEWIASDGPETFYHFVKARSPTEAAVKAIQRAIMHNRYYFFDEDGNYSNANGSPLDFTVELVIPGWVTGRAVDDDKVSSEIMKWTPQISRDGGMEAK